MANGVGFEGANKTFYAPDDSTPEECGDLQVFQDPNQIVSCWRLTPDELKKVAETGVVWVSIAGGGMPPIKISGEPLVMMGDREPSVEPYIPPAHRKVEG
mgnify:CR=1 FL=1